MNSSEIVDVCRWQQVALWGQIEITTSLNFFTRKRAVILKQHSFVTSDEFEIRDAEVSLDRSWVTDSVYIVSDKSADNRPIMLFNNTFTDSSHAIIRTIHARRAVACRSGASPRWRQTTIPWQSFSKCF